MSKRRITSSDLRQIMPPMSDEFQNNAMAKIETLVKDTEEIKMKRKASLGLVLAMVLVVALAAAALAVTYWRDTAQDIAPLEAEHGYFENWKPEDKAALARLLHDAGYIQDSADLEALLAGKLSPEDTDRLATEIITAWAGLPEWAVTFQQITEKLNGPFSQWSVEDKAWFTDTLRSNSMLSPEDIRYTLPEDQDISQDEAIAIAKATLQSVYGIRPEALDRYGVDAAFITPTWEIEGVQPGESIWNLEFTRTETMDGEDVFRVYMIELRSNGDVLGYAKNDPDSLRSAFDRLTVEKGAIYTWSPEDLAAFSKDLPARIAQAQQAGEDVDNYLLALERIQYGLPSDRDLPREQAIGIATDYVKKTYGATDRGLEKLKAYASFDVTDAQNPIWRIKLLPWLSEDYSNYESTGYVVHIHARTGDVMSARNRSTDTVHATDLF